MTSHPVFVAAFGWLLLFCPTISHGQHDADRNAVRMIALKDYKAAGRELASADSAAAETIFVKLMSQLRQGRTADAIQLVQAGLAAGLPIERFVAGPRDAFAPLYKMPAWQDVLNEHPSSTILHGPMLGNQTDRSISVWLRTASDSRVRLIVIDASTGARIAVSELVATDQNSDFTAVVSVSGLKPATRYDYQIEVDGEIVKLEGARFTTYPARNQAGKFKIAFGGGAGYVPEFEHMWSTIAAQKPDAMLMLGDNVYSDDPEHRLTQDYCYYRRQSRPEWRRLISHTPIFSIYDDHDFGTNDCIPGPEIETPAWKRQVWNVFRQNWVNPGYGGGESQPGCWYDFKIADVHFIMLDGRYYRSREGVPSMLGPVQKQWLLDTLKHSNSTFKILVTPVPFTANIKPGSNDAWDGYRQERTEIFDYLDENNIDGVLLVAADRHRTDLRFTKRKNGYDLYEFESSRLTNHHTHRVVKTPGLVWGYRKKCSFGLIEFDTTVADPTMTLTAINIDGQQLHRFELRGSQLSRTAKKD